jgi:hypothetical protein
MDARPEWGTGAEISDDSGCGCVGCLSVFGLVFASVAIWSIVSNQMEFLRLFSGIPIAIAVLVAIIALPAAVIIWFAFKIADRD